MATVVQPPKSNFNRAETNSRVRHPLQKLRGYIRTYVTLEGASVFLLYLAIWFWVGMLLDYGVFKLLTFDWVRDMPRTVGAGPFQIVRTSMLVILLGGLVALVVTKVVLRLLREFRDNSLAMVLERRFPDQLGDRLITAVEMADPKLADKYGHSQNMVDQTIRDAADRVDKLPVKKVFNWKRLVSYGLVVLGLTLGLYLLAGIGYCALVERDMSAQAMNRYLYRSRDVAGIWAERNLMLKNTRWPRSAYLEVIRFPGSRKDPDDLRISDTNPSTELWVRGVKWVIADDATEDGWRALRWQDLKEILGSEPEVDLPANWDGWTVDLDSLDKDVPANLIPESWRGKTISYVKNDLPDPNKKDPSFPGIKQLTFLAALNAVPQQNSPLNLLQGGLGATVLRDRAVLSQQALTGAATVSLLATPRGMGLFLAASTSIAARTEARPLVLADVYDNLKSKGQLEAMKRSLFEWREWTLDRIEQQLEQSSVHNVLLDRHTPALKDFEKVFKDLNNLVDSAHMERKVRRLEIPKQINLTYWSKAHTSTKTFGAGAENKYQGSLTLTESVTFRFQGADYYTPDKKITLVPRPKVKAIITNRWEPAYPHYHMNGTLLQEAAIDAEDADQEKKGGTDPEVRHKLAAKRQDLRREDREAQLALRGKKQRYQNVSASIAEQFSTIEVPVGTDLDLVAETTDDLQGEVSIEPYKKKDADKTPDLGPLEGVVVRFVKEDGVESRRKFVTQFKNVTQQIDMVLKFVNLDGVAGECHVVITPRPDDPPQVTIQMIKNVFRMKKNTDFYMVTPSAEIPFLGSITDDRGLNRVEWRFKVSPYREAETTVKAANLMRAFTMAPGGFNQHLAASSYLSTLYRGITLGEADAEMKNGLVVSTMQFPTGGFGQQLMGSTYLAWVTSTLNRLDNVESRLLKRFVDEVRARQKEDISPEKLAQMLTVAPPKTPLLTQLNLKTEEDVFNFEDHLARLKSGGLNVFQQRYKVEVWMAATDNNVDAAVPGVSESKQRFTFLVVGENELLAAIFREEEELRDRLEKVQERLKTSRAKLDSQVNNNLEDNQSSDELARRATRSEEVKDDVSGSYKEVSEVLSAFNRLLAELERNRVERVNESGKKVSHQVKDDICDPLRQMADKKDGDLKLAEDATKDLQVLLEKNLKASKGPNNKVLPIPEKDRKIRAAAGKDALVKVDKLLAQLERVLASIKKVIDKDALLRKLIEISETQRRQTELLDALEKFQHGQDIEALKGKNKP